MEDWRLLANLDHCYDEDSSFFLAQQFLQQQKDLPLKKRYKLASVTKFCTLVQEQPQLFFEKNYHFMSLCANDRSILLRNTKKYIGYLGLCFIMRRTGLLNNFVFRNSAEIIYGFDTIERIYRTVNRLDFDCPIFKLALALIVFSTFNYTYYHNISPVNLIDIQTILRIQNTYSDLTWRYLIHTYNYERAVMYFSNLIKCILSLNDIVVETTNLQQCNDMIDSIVKLTEEQMILTE